MSSNLATLIPSKDSIKSALITMAIGLLILWGMVLVGSKILQDFDLSCLISPCSPHEKRADTPAEGDVIHHYTEFITVERHNLRLEVITGIKYKNSTTKEIESQWCYIEPVNSAKDGFTSVSYTHLTLPTTSRV